MKDLNRVLSSGTIEAYCLGNLPPEQAAELIAIAAQQPEVRAEIEQTLSALERYAQVPDLPANLKSRVLDFLDPLKEEKIDLNNPPTIHLHSNASAWNQALADVKPDVEEPAFATRVLKDTEELFLSVVWLFAELIEEKHADNEFHECFFILEGACECDFEGTIVRFGAGDYFDIPPNTRHLIRNISEGLPYVKGLVQRRKAAQTQVPAT